MPNITRKIAPHLWFTDKAEEAAHFYASIFPDSHVDRVTSLPSARVVEFTLCGQSFMAISAGPHDPFNHAMSLHVTCETQAELDGYWDALLDGGMAEPCGWLRDRYGVSWQISSAALLNMMADPDRTKANRVHEAFMKMVKVDIATLQQAYDNA